MDVRVISLKPSSATPLLKELSTLVPKGSDVGVQRGVDVRGVSLNTLWESKLVSDSGAFTVETYRKWHHELPGKGSIGCYQAMRLAIPERPDRPLLLCEDDCDVHDQPQFRAQLAHLLSHLDDFDVAVFGPQFFRPEPHSPQLFGSWRKITKEHSFFCLHCVVYSPRGRAKLSGLLLHSPQSMQIDSLYQRWAGMGKLDVVYCKGVAVQRIHMSSVQETLGSCVECDGGRHYFLIFGGVVSAVLVLVLCMSRKRKGCRG